MLLKVKLLALIFDVAANDKFCILYNFYWQFNFYLLSSNFITYVIVIKCNYNFSIFILDFKTGILSSEQQTMESHRLL